MAHKASMTQLVSSILNQVHAGLDWQHWAGFLQLLTAGLAALPPAGGMQGTAAQAVALMDRCIPFSMLGHADAANRCAVGPGPAALGVHAVTCSATDTALT